MDEQGLVQLTLMPSPKCSNCFEFSAVLPIQSPPKLRGVFLPKEESEFSFVFQNQWITVRVIATGMETACLGLAIASLAFWALTVAEVGIYA